jgi:DNA-binding GntR family transcriptional regulator
MPPNPNKDFVQMAYTGIRDMFWANEIIPGQKLNYRELAAKLNMSHTPVIQALKIFEREHLVKHIPNRGYYSETHNPKEIRELYDLRKLIEVALIPDTIKNLNEENINLIQNKFDENCKAIHRDNYPKRLQTDMELHLTFAEVAGRNIYYQTLQRIFDLLYLKYRAHFYIFASRKETEPEHKNIIYYILEKDATKAKAAMRKHISKVEKYMLNSLSPFLLEKEK